MTKDQPAVSLIHEIIPVQTDIPKVSVYVFEESKNGLVYGFTVQVGEKVEFGRTAWYLPNWCKILAISLAANLAAEFSRPKNAREFRSVFRAHLKRNADWIRENKPRQ